MTETNLPSVVPISFAVSLPVPVHGCRLQMELEETSSRARVERVWRGFCGSGVVVVVMAAKCEAQEFAMLHAPRLT